MFTTRTGHPIEPRNFNRAFDVRCTRYSVRRITLHDTRRTCGSLLAALDLPLSQRGVITLTNTLSKSARLNSAKVKRVRDLARLSFVVCAERFRTSTNQTRRSQSAAAADQEVPSEIALR